MIGGSTRVGNRTNIKQSVIGKHCVIGRLARVIGCVLLDHCVIGDGYDYLPSRNPILTKESLEQSWIGVY
jgi:NDP-sugar pyrophosphorylase family protein